VIPHAGARLQHETLGIVSQPVQGECCVRVSPLPTDSPQLVSPVLRVVRAFGRSCTVIRLSTRQNRLGGGDHDG
jgi:hypothetical protein